MKTVGRTCRFRSMPNKAQETLLEKHFGCTRFVYDHFLNERKQQYLSNKKSDKYHTQTATVAKLKKQEGGLKEVDSQALQFAFCPSSKTCNVCGWINQDLSLSIREWTCKNRHHLDRDENAGINILKEALKIHRPGRSVTKVENKSDYSGSTSVETRSPIIFSGWAVIM